MQVINQCSEAEVWLREKIQQQDALPKHANPVLLSSDLKKKAETVDRSVDKSLLTPLAVPVSYV
jgi:heat shock protein 4